MNLKSMSDGAKLLKTGVLAFLATASAISPVIFSVGCPPDIQSIGTSVIFGVICFIPFTLGWQLFKRRSKRSKIVATLISISLLVLLALLAIWMNHILITVDLKNGNRHVMGFLYINDKYELLRKQANDLHEFHEEGNYIMESMYSQNSINAAKIVLIVTWFAPFVALAWILGVMYTLYPDSKNPKPSVTPKKQTKPKATDKSPAKAKGKKDATT